MDVFTKIIGIKKKKQKRNKKRIDTQPSTAVLWYKISNFSNLIHLYYMVKKVIKRVKEWWQELQARLVLRVAIEKAERLHWANGVRYWVLPTPEGSLLVLNWAEAIEYREMGIFPKKMNVNGLYQIGFYWTESKRRGNWGFMLRKGTIMKDRYMSWWYGTMRKRSGR